MKLPQLTDLPDENASLQEYGKFVDRFDPTEHFRNMWGDKYFDKVSERWEKQINLFKDNKTPDTNIQESLMILTFDYIMGPSIGIPMEEKLFSFSGYCHQSRPELKRVNISTQFNKDKNNSKNK